MIQVVTAMTDLVKGQPVAQFTLGDGTQLALAFGEQDDFWDAFDKETSRIRIGPHQGKVVRWIVCLGVDEVHEVTGPKPTKPMQDDIPWFLPNGVPGDRFADALFLDGSWLITTGVAMKIILPPRPVCGVKPFRGKKFCRVREFTVVDVLKKN